MRTTVKKPAKIQVRTYNDGDKCGFLKDDALNSRAPWRQLTGDPNLAIKEDDIKSAIQTGLLFYPLDLMTQTFPNKSWNNRYMVPRNEFFASRGIPIRRSTQQETDSIFGGEPQYLFMIDYDVNNSANYWFSAENGQLRQIDISCPDGAITSFRYEDYVQKQGEDAQFPQRFILTRTSGTGDKAILWELTVDLSDVQLNIDIPAEKFTTP